jgi:UDP-N-acetylglucosamine 2-epimerase (non-hydrolysing)
MPEEINRLITDIITNYFFTTTESARNNLRKSGIADDQIFFVGNTMIDTLKVQEACFMKPGFWQEYELEAGKYLVLTLHRPSNVDHKEQLAELVKVMEENTGGIPVIFQVHQRTRARMDSFGIQFDNIKLVDLMSYLEFNYLVKHAKGVITDSGGITEETTVMGVPCMTLRTSTERPETCTIGTNELLGSEPSALKLALDKMLRDEWKKGAIPKFWDGKTSERIVTILTKL